VSPQTAVECRTTEYSGSDCACPVKLQQYGATQYVWPVVIDPRPGAKSRWHSRILGASIVSSSPSHKSHLAPAGPYHYSLGESTAAFSADGSHRQAALMWHQALGSAPRCRSCPLDGRRRPVRAVQLRGHASQVDQAMVPTSAGVPLPGIWFELSRVSSRVTLEPGCVPTYASRVNMGAPPVLPYHLGVLACMPESTT
jgi:hypothetical protein